MRRALHGRHSGLLRPCCTTRVIFLSHFQEAVYPLLCGTRPHLGNSVEERAHTDIYKEAASQSSHLVRAPWRAAAQP